MMLFKKRNKEVKENPLQDKLAGKIAGVFITVQHGFATGMTKIFGPMKAKMIKRWLLVCCTISSGLSIYFFVDALVSKPKATFKIDQVSMPQHFDRSGDEVMEGEMPPDIYQEIQEYRHYMDSLDEPIRPGLADSIRLLEEIYLQQQEP